MSKTPSLTKLEAYARQRINASRYPNDVHIFALSRCEDCGLAPFEVTVIHHTGSRRGDFKGVILGDCADCGRSKRILSYTGSHRKPLREEKPECACGSRQFYVGECERIERDEGLPGFFDEGVVVGQCAHCGRNRALAHTD